MHKTLRKHLEECLEDRTPNWVTKWRMILTQKDKGKGNIASSYRPVTCLPQLCKLPTGIIANGIYEYLDSRSLSPEEQRGCWRASRSTHDLLYVDRMVLKEVKQREKGLAMGLMDYRKAYHTLPHSWILECLKDFAFNEQLRQFLEEDMKTWRVELTLRGQMLGELKIKEESSKEMHYLQCCL